MSLTQLSQLLPLPQEDLQQVLDYAATLSKPDAAAHFSNLLGDSPLAVDFIASFNSHRQGPAGTTASSSSGTSGAVTPNVSDDVPKAKRHTKKPKKNIHTPQPREVEDYPALTGTAYKKEDNLDYLPQRSSAPTSGSASRSSTPKPPQPPQPAQPKQHAPSAGYLISDVPSKSKAKSTPVSRTASPKPPTGQTTKVSIAGGTPMAGQSTAIADLDAAIRALEITTNPTLDDVAARKCNCVATKHPLQGAAPNCLGCGKVICMKEGLGPCTFCGAPLLNPGEVQAMMRELRDERGRERMAANAGANRRADVSKTPAPFTQPRGGDGGSLAEAEARAREHRDRLLGFQAQNARRTTVRDEAADFDVGGPPGGSMWASPEERARELKRQQKLMREMEWNARPEYEKRRQVVSIDLVGGRVMRKMADVARPASPEDEAGDGAGVDADADADPGALRETTPNRGGGAFSGNPLLGSMIKPVFDAKGKGPDQGKADRRERKTGWRRVQDDRDDNEGVILDGGVYGHGDEPDCG